MILRCDQHLRRARASCTALLQTEDTRWCEYSRKNILSIKISEKEKARVSRELVEDGGVNQRLRLSAAEVSRHREGLVVVHPSLWYLLCDEHCRGVHTPFPFFVRRFLADDRFLLGLGGTGCFDT
jgi:hypothetical protein